MARRPVHPLSADPRTASTGGHNGDMIRSWLRRHDPNSTFLTLGRDTLTFGELLDAPQPDPGQVVVAPGTDLASVVDLMTVPGPDRQMVVLDPDASASETTRRVEAAEAARTRQALTVLFTSGTSGPAKAVRLTARNWEAAVEASARHLDHRSEDVWLAAMPLHHVGGLSILYRSAFVGGSVRWVPRFDVAEVVGELRGGVTMASLVPTMLRRILDFDDQPFPELRAVLIGGGPIPPGLLEQAASRGLPVLPTYGMTETCAQVATLRPGQPPRHSAHPLPGVEVRVGRGGRIELRGDQISPGYADQEDRPPQEWFVTPDLGEISPDGALQVLGRADDVIVTGGENVDPGRVEAVLSSHPAVTAAVVVGVTDPEWGQKVVAVFEGAAPPDEVLAWARGHLSRAEVPKVLLPIAEIPWLGTKPDRLAVLRILTR